MAWHVSIEKAISKFSIQRFRGLDSFQPSSEKTKQQYQDEELCLSHGERGGFTWCARTLTGDLDDFERMAGCLVRVGLPSIEEVGERYYNDKREQPKDSYEMQFHVCVVWITWCLLHNWLTGFDSPRESFLNISSPEPTVACIQVEHLLRHVT